MTMEIGFNQSIYKYPLVDIYAAPLTGRDFQARMSIKGILI
jgi:hypothetical protein